ncbi:hypothetical protein [Streptococcus uberis]|uniref:hypothetical protein n=1 Tax=Streptococcus uberis TaxID=1349 RepID=UPI001FF3975F|nr:hypothetical protein [Streptococcus uberis]MCK1215650.1 hypothetical protein [Streptococcus uberis]
MTEFKMEVIEYNKRFPSIKTTNKTEVVVIADSIQSAYGRAFKLTPKKHMFDEDYVMKANVISLRDILVTDEEENED